MLRALNPESFPTEEQLVLRAAAIGLEESGAWPRFQYVDGVLAEQQVSDPRRSVEGVPTDLLIIQKPLKDDGELKIRVAGLQRVNPRSPQLFAFIRTLRHCVDFFESARPTSAATYTPVVAHARELWSPWRNSIGTRATMTRVGRLLEVEGIGAVTWTSDDASPWSIELTSHIRKFSQIGCIDDYVRATSAVPRLAA